MKELSIEEKAKAYDNALEIAKGLYAKDAPDSLHLERMFPILKESRDEKIRQFLIHEIEETSDEIMSYRNMNKKEVLAWLDEKPKTKKVYLWFKVGDVVCSSNGITLKIVGITDYCYNCTTTEGNKYSFGFDIQDEFELVEQKSTDKVEPKFKAGDWIITNKNHIWYVDETPETTSYLYRLINQYGKVEVAEFEIVDKKARLWTIQDAKPGDVLSWDHERYTIIFKELKDSKIIAHCSYNDHAKYFSTNSCAYDTIFDSNLRFTPASERAKKVLFEKIKEAGYEWDAEKKELMKIEQKPTVWLQELEDKLANATPQQLAEWKEKYFREESAEWSEDYLKMLDEMYEFFDKHKIPCLKHNMDDYAKFIKSLKDRVLPQPKQEWSGGDEAHLHSLITHLEQWIERHPNTTGADIQGENIAWLKSLRPQSTWKPSESQMKWLHDAIESTQYEPRKQALISLYSDLMELKI